MSQWFQLRHGGELDARRAKERRRSITDPLLALVPEDSTYVYDIGQGCRFDPKSGAVQSPKADFPAKTVAEFVELAEIRQKRSSCSGFAKGIDLQHVPYHGMPQALTD
jgi:hypothetical protein